MSKNDSPAFPVLGYDLSASGDIRPQPAVHTGMTIRDWFAGRSITGFLPGAEYTDSEVQALAKKAYRFADAMIKAREKT